MSDLEVHASLNSSSVPSQQCPQTQTVSRNRPARRSLSALSSTLSASSSLSGSETTTTESPSLFPGRFKNYHKPTVTDSPHLVSLCHKYIDELNVDGLAKIARRRGLPPHLRQYAWPLLLSSHPYALEPSIISEFPSGPISDEQIPYKRIRGDIMRYRKRFGTCSSTSTSAATTNGTPSRSSTFINNGASLARNSTGVTSLNYSNSSTTTPTEQASSLSSSVTSSNLEDGKVVQYLNDSLEDQSFELIEEAIIKFLEKWGSVVPYETALSYAAFALVEWLNPVYEMENAASSSSYGSGSSQGSTPEMRPVTMWDSENGFSFYSTFERLILVILNSPASTTDGPSGPSDSPTAERISRFLSVFRKLLPEVWEHFCEEDVVSLIGGDEWLLWWIKWHGVKVWNKHDRARIWDMLFGWRPDNGGNFVSSNPNATSGMDDDVDLGPDPFWDPMQLDSAKILDPHSQQTFISLVLLKSMSSTLLELDQNEIRQFLSRMPRSKDVESIVVGAGECWRSWEFGEDHSDEEDD